MRNTNDPSDRPRGLCADCGISFSGLREIPQSPESPVVCPTCEDRRRRIDASRNDRPPYGCIETRRLERASSTARVALQGRAALFHLDRARRCGRCSAPKPAGRPGWSVLIRHGHELALCASCSTHRGRPRPTRPKTRQWGQLYAREDWLGARSTRRQGC